MIFQQYYIYLRAFILSVINAETGGQVATQEIITFQGLIHALENFWAGQGCVVLQPLDMEVGAGTFHPATFLRAIGPESWNAAYVQPSRRPTDGRYGENPNRLQHYYQFQVILKPSPDNIQDLYLQSLKELGIDTAIHDVRFVEDNWESPTLGAWGLGWEVWLNGMEVTQFTYFQQVGGIECFPVSGEITYGLERIAMYLQGSIAFTISSGITARTARAPMVTCFTRTKLNSQNLISNTPTYLSCLNNSTTLKPRAKS